MGQKTQTELVREAEGNHHIMHRITPSMYKCRRCEAHISQNDHCQWSSRKTGTFCPSAVVTLSGDENTQAVAAA